VLNKIALIKNTSDIKKIITNELTLHLNLKSLKSLEDLLTKCNFTAKQYQTFAEKPPLTLLNYNSRKLLLDLVHDDILPAIVVYYPLEVRQALLDAATKKNVHELLQTHGFEFFQLLEQDPKKAAKFIFKNLTNEPFVEIQLDINDCKLKADKILKEFKSSLSNKSTLALGYASITSGNLLSLMQHKEYIYLEPVKEFIISSDCKYMLSMILPFNDYLQLINKLENDDSITLVAQVFLEYIKNNGDRNFNNLKAVELINKSLKLNLKSIEDVSKQAGDKLKEIMQNVKSDPINFINNSYLELQHKTICENFLPVIASFIISKDKQLNFLSQATNNPQLLNILLLNYEQLKLLTKSQNDFNNLKKVLVSICNKLDKTCTYKESDYINLAEQSNIHAGQLVLELKEIALAQYLATDQCMEFLALFFNEKDLNILQNIFINSPNADENSLQFARVLLSNQIDLKDYASSSDKVLVLLKQNFPELSGIDTISQRLNSFNDFRMSVINNKESHLQEVAITKLVKQELLPLLLHKEFQSFLKQSLSFLNQSDLELILINLNINQPQQKSRQLARFITLVLNKDSKALTEEFLTMQVDEDGKLNFDNTALANTMTLAANVFEELLNCHCYYNQCNNQGRQESAEMPEVVIPNPNILDKLSAHIKQIRVKAINDSFASNSARLIFFTKGISNGLPKASRLAGFSSLATIKRLKRINSQILKPLWWSINLSKVSFWFIKTSNSALNIIKKTFNFFIDILKSLTNFITAIFVNEPAFIISEDDESIDIDYSESSFAYAKILNKLKPLEASDVNVDANNCPNDLVEELEAFIDNNCHEVKAPAPALIF